MAEERGMTALQLNLHAELDDAIDSAVDELQSKIAKSGEQLIVDSRLAWFFFHDAFKVHLITEPNEAARRVLARPHSEVERYSTLEEAKERLHGRSESERTRFLSRYGADKTRLRNYDLVCDSTSASPEEIVERIVENLTAPRDETVLCVDPRRIEVDGVRVDGPVMLGYVRPDFFAVSGHGIVTDAYESGATLVEGMLAAEITTPQKS
jgi:cytidylate kinase